jgi:acyl carrier protein
MDEPQQPNYIHRNRILAEVAQVIRNTFNAPQLAITRETTAEEVPGWDSLSHAILLMRVERAFGILLEPSDVVFLENVGELADMVAAKRL